MAPHFVRAQNAYKGTQMRAIHHARTHTHTHTHTQFQSVTFLTYPFIGVACENCQWSTFVLSQQRSKETLLPKELRAIQPRPLPYFNGLDRRLRLIYGRIRELKIVTSVNGELLNSKVGKLYNCCTCRKHTYGWVKLPSGPSTDFMPV